MLACLNNDFSWFVKMLEESVTVAVTSISDLMF